MSPESRLHFQQRGAGLPVALFVITVLALLVASMAQLQESSGQSVSLQIQSQRAFFAAESGAQVAVAEVLEGESCGSVTASLDFSAPGGLGGCRTATTCASVTASAAPWGTGGDRVYTITSTGRCGAGPDQSERIVEVRVR